MLCVTKVAEDRFKCPAWVSATPTLPHARCRACCSWSVRHIVLRCTLCAGSRCSKAPTWCGPHCTFAQLNSNAMCHCGTSDSHIPETPWCGLQVQVIDLSRKSVHLLGRQKALHAPVAVPSLWLCFTVPATCRGCATSCSSTRRYRGSMQQWCTTTMARCTYWTWALPMVCRIAACPCSLSHPPCVCVAGTWVGSNRLAANESCELLEGSMLVFGQSTRCTPHT